MAAGQPNRLRVGPHVYKLQWRNEPFVSGNCAVTGSTDTSQHVMAVQVASPSYTRSTLIHEVLHALVEAYGLSPHLADEELFCRAFEGPLLALLIDNPRIVEFLMEVQ